MTETPAAATITPAYQTERLRVMHASYAAAKALAESSAAAFKTIADAIKATLTDNVPNTERFPRGELLVLDEGGVVAQ